MAGKDRAHIRLRRAWMSSHFTLLENPEVALAMLAAMPCAVIDQRERVIEANAAFAAKLNRPLSNIVGIELMPLMRGVALDEGHSEGVDCYRFRSGQDECWVRLQRFPWKSRQLVTLVEVTAEWRALAAMVTASSARSQLMGEAEVGTWRFDPDAELYHFSSELSLGHKEAGKPVPLALLQRIQHPDDRAKDTEIRERLTQEPGSHTGEVRYRAGNGEWTTLRVRYRSGRKLPSGKYEMFGMTQNITDLAKARDQADTMSERLEMAMAAANAGVWEIDLKTGTRWSSDKFQEILGSEALERERAAPFGMYTDDEQTRVRESWQRCLKSGQTETIDTKLYCPNGDGRWVRMFTRVQMDSNGGPKRAVGLMLDINSHKHQELALIEAKQQAEAATVAKSNFLASMSHEIRTPLNGILGMAQVLAADELTEAQKDRVKVIAESGQTLTALLNDVLDISKIEAGKLDIARVEGDLALTVERVRQLFLSRAEEHGLSLTLEVPAALPKRLRYDPVRVRQCVSNLVSNAIKFTERGKISIVLGAEQMEGGDWRAKISVSDTGIGMDASTVSRLFSSFTQADASITRRFGGSGLGLAITKQLARLMGGDAGVESKLSAGSTFHFTFIAEAGGAYAPASLETENADQPPAETPVRNVIGARVLLVDDNAVNRQVVKLFMAQLAPQITEAVNGQEALNKLAEQPFDIVLLDVHMPVMDGKEAIRRIRASDKPWRDIPVIALTADAMSGDKERFLGMGMSDYISKPIDARELATKFVRLLQDKPLVAATMVA
jgi:PAS domain S-box-containing protein